ncbi:MAG TPA: ectoine/hydroxyectoine ABC transporter substrate-binding protein EhuB [Acidimicrobiia bacterium]|nr:ectoine/hydroxyectoine ABC transporter substrate-binding protein EhuB [Acidimicrobiia bacterium]
MKRRTTFLTRILALLAVLSLALAACGGAEEGGETTSGGAGDTTGDTSADGGGDGALSEMFPEGTVRIGIANEVPYGYEGEDGEPTGEAPELAKAILGELGIDNVEATVVEFGSLIPGLLAGQYDMIAAGMFINPERAEQVAFSDPDYCADTSFAVEEGNPLGLENFESFLDSDATLGVLGGAVEETYAVETGIPDGQISRFGDTPSLVDALTAGRIDAFALTGPTVQAQVAELDGYEATPGFIPVIDGEEQLGCGAFAFPPDNTEFRDIFNEKLNEFQEEDRVLPIIEEFGFSEAAVEAAKDLTVEDLTGG